MGVEFLFGSRKCSGSLAEVVVSPLCVGVPNATEPLTLKWVICAVVSLTSVRMPYCAPLLPLEVCDPCSTWLVDSLPPPRDLGETYGLLLSVGCPLPQQFDHGGSHMKSKDRS